MSILVKIRELMWAKICLRRCNHVGALPRVQGKVIVSNYGRIEIGERVRLRGIHVPIELASMSGGVLTIGRNCSINSGVSIAASQSVAIGDNCLIGNYTLIMDTDFHDIGRRNELGKSEAVRLEDDVWLGAGVTVLKGVTIGRGSAVMAGSVVIANVPEYTLVGGVPARTIKALDRPGANPAQPESIEALAPGKSVESGT